MVDMKLALSLGVLALATPLMFSPAFASFDDQFVCDAIGDGAYTITISSKDPSQASILYQLDIDAPQGVALEPTELIAAPTGSGFRYVSEEFDFRGKGTEATLTEGGAVVDCRFLGEPVMEEEGSGNLPDLSNDMAWPPLNAMGFSLGGKVRSAPSMEAPQTDSLQFKEPVVLIQNTGVEMNGYYWFKISYGEGEEGYQWGGIMCSDALHVIGIYESCE
jgi:hypothetical protein